MCITAFFLNPHPTPGSWKFALVFNRDEYYSRPTKPASIWHDTDIIAGRDLQDGKDDGTWFGVNKRGKLAFVLNVKENLKTNLEAKGRGLLVTNFLRGDLGPEEYTTMLSKEGQLYHPFNFFCFDLGTKNNFEAYYYSNRSAGTPCKLNPGYHGCSNSTLEKPWPKVFHLTSSFEEVISSHSTKDENEVIEKVLEIVSKETRIDGYEFAFQEDLSPDKVSSIYFPRLIMVKTPWCGTRSTTVLLVKDNNGVVFVERYLEQPIRAVNYKWRTNKYRFTVCS